MKSIVLLSGPVGAGKTTVANELVALSPGPVACIEGDKFWFFIAKSGGISRHKNFKTIMASMAAAALPYAGAGYEVIVDFSVPPWFLETFHKIVKLRKIPLDYVVLRPSEEVCAARAAVRPEGKIKDYSVFSDLYASFDEAAKHTICDNTGEAPAIAARIREGLDSGLFRVS